MDTKVIALLLAGGHGCRMHRERPKQFIEVDGKPVFLYTMQAFEQHPEVDEIFLVCENEWKGYVSEQTKQAGVHKFSGIFQAGNTSLESLRNGIQGIADTLTSTRDIIIMTHDSVRPLISKQLITDNLQICRQKGNAIAGITSCEAYIVSSDGDMFEGMISREALYRAQTPQTFYLEDLQKIFRQAKQEGITHSQSLYTLAATLNWPLHISKGEELNFKITIPTDIDIFQAIVSYQKKKTFHEYDRPDHSN